MDSGAKIRIKVGSMEVEYEGEPSFLKDGLESLLSKMADLSTQVLPELETTSDATNGSISSAPSNGFDFSTSTIAAHLGANSTTELAICALAKLELVDGNAGVKQGDISKEMRTATTYYKKSMSSNLGSSLRTLIKNNRVNHGASDTYSLSATEKTRLEGSIANIG
ncbi:hypothetical protein [Profundibacter amoris]|uniref:Uncharacterized protein n=1 Tax=Profundibacter amoris TaxID=2171755 RepID=A0A347UFD5_9RHOB|nr:hypothetical protein [Profundibacter amoris]AXX97563.1 hypothetical protein BAR1_06215 [Profundibacter amoris]